MVAGSFPIVKLGYLAIKQISRPIANQIKRNAKACPSFGKYVCMPPAQLYHWMEVNCRLRLMGLGKAKQVHKLTDDIAIELGAQMLGEFVIFTAAAATIWLEYRLSAAKEGLKEEQGKQTLLQLDQRLQDLDLLTRMQDTKIRQLQRTVEDLETENQSLLTRLEGEERQEK